MNLVIKLFFFVIIGFVVMVVWVVLFEVVDCGWKVQVELVGNGDCVFVLVCMKELVDFQNIVFNGLEFYLQI